MEYFYDEKRNSLTSGVIESSQLTPTFYYLLEWHSSFSTEIPYSIKSIMDYK